MLEVIAIIQDEAHELDICWAALALSILTNANPDNALERLYRTPTQQETTVKMCLLRETGYTFEEIGKLFGITKTGAFRRINRYKEAMSKQESLNIKNIPAAAGEQLQPEKASVPGKRWITHQDTSPDRWDALDNAQATNKQTR